MCVYVCVCVCVLAKILLVGEVLLLVPVQACPDLASKGCVTMNPPAVTFQCKPR